MFSFGTYYSYIYNTNLETLQLHFLHQPWNAILGFMDYVQYKTSPPRIDLSGQAGVSSQSSKILWLGAR